MPDGVDEAEFEICSFAAVPELATLSAPVRKDCAEGGALVNPAINSCATLVVQRVFVLRASVLAPDNAASPDGSAVDVDVLANDTLSEIAQGALQSVENGEHGTAELVDGKVRYTPDAGFTGTDTVKYTVLDQRTGTALTSTITIDVTAAPVPEPDPEPTTDPVPDPTTDPAPQTDGSPAPVAASGTTAVAPQTTATTAGKSTLAKTGAPVGSWAALATGLLTAGFAAARAGRRRA